MRARPSSLSRETVRERRVHPEVRGNTYPQLVSSVRDVTVAVEIIGLGYVRLPLVIAFSRRIRVFGYDNDSKRMKQLTKGNSHAEDVNDVILRKSQKSRLRVCHNPGELAQYDI